MLFTSCPDCRTTFRITVETLHRADGKVRCGQCERVFSAFDELTDQLPGAAARAAETPTGDPTAAARRDSARERPAAARAAGETEAAPAAEQAEPATEQIGRRVDPDENAPLGDLPPILEGEFIEAALQAEEDEEEPEVQFSDADADDLRSFEANRMSAPWSLEATDAKFKSRGGWWATAASIAALLLLIQAAHHFREDLLQVPYLGTGLRAAYALLGRPLPMSWNPDEFEIVNWATTAEDGPDQEGSLHFTAGILNRGRVSQPMPLVYLELTDRWEQKIGSRYFRPDEYLTHGFSPSAMLPPQGVANVRLDLLDPGPGAYGFEVDVCIEIDANVLRCKSDRIFE